MGILVSGELLDEQGVLAMLFERQEKLPLRVVADAFVAPVGDDEEAALRVGDDAPDVFHSWGGGVFYEQAAAGVLRPVEDALSQEAKDNMGTSGVSAFTAPDGHLYGVARDVSCGNLERQHIGL